MSNEASRSTPAELPKTTPSGAAPQASARPGPPPHPFHVAMLQAAQHLLRHHPALALTLGYLFLTAVGMIYEWLFFRRFNIQIFHFAEPTDFLLVAVREPLLLVFTVISVLVLVRFINRHSKRLGQAGSYRRFYLWLQSKPWWGVLERLTYLAVVVGYFVSLTYVYAGYRADRVCRGEGSGVVVELLSDATTGKPGETTGKAYLLLGNTSKYLLVYDQVAKRTHILSANNLARLATLP